MRIRLSGHKISKIADHHKKLGWLTKIENGDCIFLKREGKKAHCSIYKYRPRDCRIFPHFYEKNINCGDIIKEYNYKQYGDSEFVEIIMK